MAEPSSAYNLQDLLLRVAIAAKVAYYGSTGASKATIPIDEYNFDTCLRCVNDGIKMFKAHAPEEGWRWMNREQEVTFGIVETTGECDSAGSSTTLVDSDLEDTYDTDDEINGYYVYDLTQEIYAVVTSYTASGGTVTVAAWLDYEGEVSTLTPADEDEYSITDVKTVHGDKSRYYLNDDFQGDYSGEITYAKGSNRGHIISWVGEGRIRQDREVSVNTGRPARATVRPSPVRRKWELFIDPSPTAADTVVFPYRVGFDDLQGVIGVSTTSGDTSVTIGGLANLYPINYFKGWYAYCVAGTGIGSYAKITASSVAGALTVADWLSLDGTAGGTNPATTAAYMFITDNKKHPAGAQFDDAILSACLACAELEFEGDDLSGRVEKFLNLDLPEAHRIDRRSAPKRLGPILPGTQRHGRERDFNSVEYN